jgi:hypothetical protein
MNPNRLPLSGKTKGGPDFMVYECGKTYTGDVSITSGCLSTRFNEKNTQYKEFSDIIHAVTCPYIMSIKGAIDRRSVECIDMITKDKRVTYDVVANTQFALIHGLSIDFHELALRSVLSQRKQLAEQKRKL